MVSKSANYCFAGPGNPTVRAPPPLPPPRRPQQRDSPGIGVGRAEHEPPAQGLLLLCEVALGEMNELTQADYNADKLPKGRHSTKGLGRTYPDPSQALTLPDGVVVPLGKPITSAQAGSRALSLMYNEFIVYHVEQLRIRYLLQVDFVFN